MNEKGIYCLRGLLGLMALVLIGCGQFEARHPDDLLDGGRGIDSLEDLDRYMEGVYGNPMFRLAEVTTARDPLRLKVEPRSRAESPSSGARLLPKGSRIQVYWPTDIENNHIKIFHNNQTLWVTYRSSSRKYVTLLEDIAIPTVQPVARLQRSSNPSGGSSSSGNNYVEPRETTVTLANLQRVTLSSSALDEAVLAIQKVELSPSEVASCSFNPLIGNGASGERCYEKVIISRDFRNFISDHGYQCAQEAARETFGRSGDKILFHTAGAGQVRRNRYVGSGPKLSVHATGQAFDLYAISVIFGSNNVRRVVLHKNHTDGSSQTERENHKFYWSYANCWEEKVKAHSPCACRGSHSGTLTYKYNSAHHDHIHMSLPFCERSRFNVSCV